MSNDGGTAHTIELTVCAICKRLVDEQTDGGAIFLFPAPLPLGAWIGYACQDCRVQARIFHDCAKRIRAGTFTEAEAGLFERSGELLREIGKLDRKKETLASAWANLLPLEDVTNELVE